jgi:Dolichyl-phosphate-mannose-protein mannosyltransferase
MRQRLSGYLRKGWFPAVVILLYLYNFPYFAAINSANELPRIYLTMAIVERGALNIDPELHRFAPTPDTSTYKGKLFVNKAPGMSFLTIPVYVVQKLANGWRTPELPQMFYWFRLFGVIVPSLLFLVLLWRFLSLHIQDRGARRMVLAAYALGSMALTYGTLLIAHQLSGLLLATAYILIHLHHHGRAGPRDLALAGIAAGAGVLVDYQVAFIGPPLFIYLLWGRGPRLRSALLFCAGAAPPLIGLLLYQWGCFDSPFKTGYHFPTNLLFQQWHSQGFLGMKAFSYEAFNGSFFRADNGLFYFSPFLLLAGPGLAVMAWRRGLRADALLCLVLIVFFGYFVSSLTFWRSGWAVGPRYITCALPYFLVPIAALMGALGRSWYGRAVPYGLMATSIVIYLLSNAVFPHYPESFSNPLFDVTLRFGGAGYLPYNLGWLLGLEGLPSVLPYLVVVVALVIALALGGAGRLWQRAACAVVTLALVAAVFGLYARQLNDRPLPVPVRFLPWMERIWEPRHAGMDLQRVMPSGDPRSSGLGTVKPWKLLR